MNMSIISVPTDPSFVRHFVNHHCSHHIHYIQGIAMVQRTDLVQNLKFVAMDAKIII